MKVHADNTDNASNAGSADKVSAAGNEANLYAAACANEHYVGEVFASVAPRYDLANERISLGRQSIWKQKLIDRVVAACAASDPGMVLDVCCGTGDICERIARENPNVFVTGIDCSKAMLEIACERARGLDNLMHVYGNAMKLPFEDNSFDAAAISFGLRNTFDYERVLREMERVVRAGGVVACLDASTPDNLLIRPFYHLYYKYVMTFLGGGLSKHKDYKWLYKSTQEFLSKAELSALMQKIGLEFVSVRPFMFGAAALHVGVVPRCAE